MSDELAAYLRFYRDLGFDHLYTAEASPVESAAPEPDPIPAVESKMPPAPAGVSAAPTDALRIIREDIGDCTRCRLHTGRANIVFGSGPADARLVFVGEGPGAEEDEQGFPFVGRAGQLLTKMIDGTAQGEGLTARRSDVYICNVVKCRPPGNRNPEPDEMEICGQFLERQLEAIRPKAICVLGGVAAKALLKTPIGITKLRGEWHAWRDIPVMPTFHPSFLLRAYNAEAKKLAWEDLKKVLHFVYD
jgi:uracil-DNA glycosylase